MINNFLIKTIGYIFNVTITASVELTRQVFTGIYLEFLENYILFCK